MTQPDPIPPREPSAVVQFFRDPIIQKWIERLIAVAIAAYFGVKINTVHTTTEQTKDVATESAQKAEVAAKVGVENQKLNTAAVQTLAHSTADPVAVKAAEDAKATTQEVR